MTAIKQYFPSNEHSLSYPDKINAAFEILERSKNLQAPAIYSETAIWTYQNFIEKINKIANYLSTNFKLQPGTRILLNGFSSPYLAATWFAILKLGCIAVTTVSMLRERELSSIIELSHSALIIADFKNNEEILKAAAKIHFLKRVVFFNSKDENTLENLIEKESIEFSAFSTNADDFAILAFTSGSTGKPKGTLHTHRDLMYICDCFPKDILKVQSTDIICGTPPLAFTYGLGGMLLFPLRYGAATVLLDKLSPENLLAAIEKYKVSISFSSATAYRLMLPLLHKYKLESLKKCVSAGEPLPKSTFHLWQEKTGIKIIDGIGSTEMLHIFISAAEDQIKPGTTGKPIPGYQAKIIDENGKELPNNTIGLLSIIGPTGCQYLEKDLEEKYVKNGWNMTGDLYQKDEQGYFHFHSRADDLILSSGYSISGVEIENVILEYPEVEECAVVGIPDETRGHLIKAYIKLKNSEELEEILKDISGFIARNIKDFVRENLAIYKCPHIVEFVHNLPRNPVGKVQKFKLK
jgi:2-aminobenzoate-CoA ligase